MVVLDQCSESAQVSRKGLDEKMRRSVKHARGLI